MLPVDSVPPLLSFHGRVLVSASRLRLDGWVLASVPRLLFFGWLGAGFRPSSASRRLGAGFSPSSSFLWTVGCWFQPLVSISMVGCWLQSLICVSTIGYWLQSVPCPSWGRRALTCDDGCWSLPAPRPSMDASHYWLLVLVGSQVLLCHGVRVSGRNSMCVYVLFTVSLTNVLPSHAPFPSPSRAASLDLLQVGVDQPEKIVPKSWSTTSSPTVRGPYYFGAQSPSDSPPQDSALLSVTPETHIDSDSLPLIPA